MPLYDLMLLLDPGAPSDRQESILRDVQGIIEGGGKLVGTYDWGSRRMTFEINHRPDAAYHLFQFEADGGGALLNQVDHSLKIMDGVLRHRIIRLKDGSPPPPAPRPEGRGGYEGYDAPDAAPVDPAAAPANGAAAETPAVDGAPADAPSADAVAADAAPAEAAASGAAPSDAAASDAAGTDAAPAAETVAADSAPADAPAADAVPADAAAEPAADAAPEAEPSDEDAPAGPPAA